MVVGCFMAKILVLDFIWPVELEVIDTCLTLGLQYGDCLDGWKKRKKMGKRIFQTP